MSYVRLAAEFLLRLLLGLTRFAFFSLALGALGPALMPSSSLVQEGTSSWVAALSRSVILVGVIFLAGAILLVAARWLVPGARPADPDPAAPPSSGSGWLWIFGPVMLGLAGGAALVSGKLLRLWGEIGAFLDRAGIWREVERGGELSGLVFLPVLFALAAPILATAAAIFLGAVPLLLVVLFAKRSSFFRKGFLMTAVCQIVLVGASLLATETLAQSVRELAGYPALGSDGEVRQLIAGLQHMRDVVRATGRDYAWLAAGYCLMLPWVVFSRRVAEDFPPEPPRAQSSLNATNPRRMG